MKINKEEIKSRILKHRVLIGSLLSAWLLASLCFCLFVGMSTLGFGTLVGISAQTVLAETPVSTLSIELVSTPILESTVIIKTEESVNTATLVNINLPTATVTTVPTSVAPILLSGSGDSIVDFENPFDFAIVHITGNASSRYFSVVNYNGDGKQIDLLVSTTDPYDGIRPLDFKNNEHTVRFEIKSDGNWTIEILSIASARTLLVPNIINGIGDEVIVLSGLEPDTAIIKGNDESRYFGVMGYGKRVNLLVSTTDPYEGTVILSSDIIILEINAVGTWSIEVKTK